MEAQVDRMGLLQVGPVGHQNNPLEYWITMFTYQELMTSQNPPKKPGPPGPGGPQPGGPPGPGPGPGPPGPILSNDFLFENVLKFLERKKEKEDMKLGMELRKDY
ncbi:unnamed protein product [Sphenostylis stenocarpa]|uniref:Uncharacterized protein n=1 Tax=Sphenostylis stenocarpa TaxID=92480 RepID=A0AA86VNC0_9FABA|nr:unnamed protein product [Sphenostylis stenocarpa]